MIFVILSLFFFLLLVLILYFLIDRKTTYKDLSGKHVVITGGSSGIGKAAAMEAAKLGANVTIIGRDEEKLKSNLNDVKAQNTSPNQKIQYTVLDVTSKPETIQQSLLKLEVDIGPIFMLVNCAGMCICGQFEDMKEEDIKYMIDLNYLGSAYPTKYVIPGMKERNEGIIVFVSSEAALIGIYGYSAYSAAKWAVRGLAESLNMELVGTNISLTLAFPPDTDTPGFAKEELTKPKETKLISGSGGLQSPDYVGKKIIHDAMARKVYSAFGLSGQMMSLLFCGSVDSITQVLVQIFSMGILRTIMVGVMFSFNKIVKDGLVEKQKETNKKEN